jgi:hypothetical protein
MAADRRVSQSNGKPKTPARVVPDDQTDENIFLFVPNLIGMNDTIQQAARKHTNSPAQATSVSS